VDILFLAPSDYLDPLSESWHPDLRHTIGFLRRQGIDAGFLAPPDLTPPEPLIKGILAENPQSIFVHLTEENIDAVVTFLRMLRRNCGRVRILAGGIPATLSSRKLLEWCPEIEWLVAGEREFTLLEYARKLRKGESLDDVQGLRSRSFYNPPRPLIADLDMLGPMIQDGLEALLALIPPERRAGYVMSSRGCYSRCSFCGIPGFYRSTGQGWRGRGVTAVVDEMEVLSEKFSLRYFIIQDDNFFPPGEAGLERARRFAHEILNRHLDVLFFFPCRISDVRQESFALLKEAGLDRVGIGVESMHDKSLRLFQKGIRPEAIPPALDVLNDLHISVEINMIFFDPHISLKGVRRNLDLLEYVRQQEFLFYSNAFPFNELKVFPWSPVAARLRKEGLLDEATGACLYHDSRVGALVEWVRRIRGKVGVNFKHQSFIEDSALDSSLYPETRMSDGGRLLVASLRQWIGLHLFPRYLKLACDVVEETDSAWEQRLGDLEARLMEEINQSPIGAMLGHCQVVDHST
jgi:hypothetical protein